MDRLVGKKAPDFHMKAVTGDGEAFTDVCLNDYRGKWLILLFYPLDFTFVCPTEITSFSDNHDIFKEAGADILSVSTDSAYSHQEWIRNGLGKIKYPMASDKTMTVSSDYGVLAEDEGIALRGLFIIDENQIIRYSVVHDNNIGRNTMETFRVLKALQSEGMCKADWQIGDNNLVHEDNPSIEILSHMDEAVKIYTQPGCSYCKRIKDFLSEHCISYQEINLETDAAGQAFMEERGYTALPVTVIKGQEISGFRLDKLKEILT